ncbi:MAG: DUF2062 domain-containing protein [Nitrospirae bacterium]|nr:DUF2062 domain-containing protein [Nitrospirota bacterium]
MINILIVIPTFNNLKTLRTVTEKAVSTGLKVLVVNDGSTDGGPETLAGLSVTLLDFTDNRGKGSAILSAAEWAETNGYTHIITIDADGQHDPGDAALFPDLIRENPWTIIVGTRQFGEMVPFSSRFGRKFSNMWVWITTGWRVPDSQSGFRAYPVAALRQVKCQGRKYNFEVEILVRGIWAGLSIVHKDISVHYSDETIKASHFDPLRDNARISWTYTRLVLRNFLPWPHKVIFNTDSEEKLSILHPIRSFKLLLRESLSPKDMALSSMLGVFLGALPLIACHSIMIFFVATRLRLNRLVALSVSNICMPPFVPGLAVAVGYYMRHGSYLTEFNMQTLGYEAPQRLLEYLIGSLIIGPVLAVLVGAIAFLTGIFYQNLRVSKGTDGQRG